jgi:hypothetical protein
MPPPVLSRHLVSPYVLFPRTLVARKTLFQTWR